MWGTSNGAAHTKKGIGLHISLPGVMSYESPQAKSDLQAARRLRPAQPLGTTISNSKLGEVDHVDADAVVQVAANSIAAALQFSF